MNIVCDNCQSKFAIPDDKLPPGKTATLKCPKCEGRITVTGQAASVIDQFVDTEVNGYHADESPFGYIDEDVETAMICEMDPALKGQIITALGAMGYRLTEAVDARTALRNMRYHAYNVVVVNELFGADDPRSNGVLIYLERQLMSVRRDIFVALVSRRFRTMDPMMAFNHSVDLIINVEQIGDFGKILARGLKEKKAFYRVMKETFRKLGRY